MVVDCASDREDGGRTVCDKEACCSLRNTDDELHTKQEHLVATSLTSNTVHSIGFPVADTASHDGANLLLEH